MPLHTGRLEKRIQMKVPVQLATPEHRGEPERTLTENVSSGGVRVVTGRPRDVDQRLLFVSPAGDLRVPARVVYCQALGGEQFAVGLQFQARFLNWWNQPSRRAP